MIFYIPIKQFNCIDGIYGHYKRVFAQSEVEALLKLKRGLQPPYIVLNSKIIKY